LRRRAKRAGNPSPSSSAASKDTNVAETEKPSHAGPVGQIFEPMTVAKAPVMAAPDQPVDILKSLGLAPVLEFDRDALYRLPQSRTPVPLCSVEELAAKSPHLAATDLLANKKAEVARLKSSLASLNENDTVYATMTAEIDKAQAVVTKLEKNAPGPTVLTAKLKLLKHEQAQKEAQQNQLSDRGKAKAAEKLQEHIRAIDQLSAALGKRRQEVLQAHHEADVAWEEIHCKQREQWTALRASFDVQIAAAEAAHAGPEVDMAVDGGNVPVDIGRQLLEDQAAASNAIAAAAHAQQQLVIQQAQAQAQQLKSVDEVERIVALAPEDFPQTVVEPQQAQWELLHQLWQSLETVAKHERFTGMHFPITLGGLRGGLEVPKLLLGDTAWSKFFPGALPTEATVVPLQVRQWLWHSLQTHRDKLLADKSKQDAAYAEVVAELESTVTDFKKRRLGSDAPQPVAAE